MAIAASRARAPFASDPARSRGRLHAEPDSVTRNPFRRDCDRIIHSTAFRRLAYKTQVFVPHEGDHFRNRLTHTLEVVQIARSLARALGLDEDLAEANALGHDLGHPPFGHAGERALDEVARPWGGFDHNAQSLRVVTRLEARYPSFDGLNLTWETLEGLVKHNGPLTTREGVGIGRFADTGVPAAITAWSEIQDLQLWSHGSAEAQVAALADDIAYDVHDIDDGLRAGLFTLADLGELPLAGDILAGIRREHPGLEPVRTTHELGRRMITHLIEDAVAETDRRMAEAAPASAEDVRRAGRGLVGLSAPVAEAEAAIKTFLFRRMYRHERVMRVMGEAQGVVRDLFGWFFARPDDLPPEWRRGLDAADEARRARRVADFIAGMTDRYALAIHARHFPTTPELR